MTCTQCRAALTQTRFFTSLSIDLAPDLTLSSISFASDLISFPTREASCSASFAAVRMGDLPCCCLWLARQSQHQCGEREIAGSWLHSLVDSIQAVQASHAHKCIDCREAVVDWCNDERVSDPDHARGGKG